MRSRRALWSRNDKAVLKLTSSRRKQGTSVPERPEMESRSGGVLDTRLRGYDGLLWGDAVQSRAQRLLQIGDQIFLVLDADRQPYHVRCCARLDLRGIVELAVCRRRRVNHQRTGVADIGEMRKQFQVRHQVDAGLIAALEAEGEHRASALGRIFAREVVVFISR